MGEDSGLLAEIAALAGAINRAKTTGQQGQPFPTPSANPHHHQAPSYRGRGGYGFPSRGRGRGGYQYPPQSYTSKPWNSTAPASSASTSAAAAPRQSMNKTLSISSNATSSASTSYAPPSTLPVASTSTTVQTASNSRLPSSREVVIDGVTFISDERGKKLVRKEGATSSTDTPAQLTPLKTSVQGQTYVRTKSGNLISSELLKQRLAAKKLREAAGVAAVPSTFRAGFRGRGRGRGRGGTSWGIGSGVVDEAKRKRIEGLMGTVAGVQSARSRNKVLGKGKKVIVKQKRPCRFFAKTGECKRGLTCPYTHDPDKVAICQRFLRNKCPNTGTSCPLSHTPNANRMPHCVHFPNCKKGSSCIYPHVKVDSDAPACKDFSELRWCELGEACKKRHVWECPEFSEKGTCETKGCKLPHIIRRQKVGAGSKEVQQEDDDGDDVVLGRSQLRDDGAEPGKSRPRKRKLALGISQNFTNDDDITTSQTREEEENEHASKKQRFASKLEDNADFVNFLSSDDEGGEDEDEDEDEDDDDDEGDEDKDEDEDEDDVDEQMEGAEGEEGDDASVNSEEEADEPMVFGDAPCIAEDQEPIAPQGEAGDASDDSDFDPETQLLVHH